LAPVRDPEQVATVVAAALGIQEQSGTPLADTLAQALAGQQLLLVLDNCEHVLDMATQLCAGLLTACDDVRVLATSRNRWRPSSLAAPATKQPSSPSAISPIQPKNPWLISAASVIRSTAASRIGDLLSGRSRVRVAVGTQIMQLDTDIRNYECSVSVLLAGTHSI
jgi:hypothetical protein